MAVRKDKGSWWVDFTVRGERHRLRSPDNRREGAVAFEHTLRSRIAQGQRVYLARDPRSRELPLTRQTLGAFVPEWFETYVRTNLKPSTQAGYAGALKRYVLPFFGSYELEAITTHLVEDFKAHHERARCSPKTINNALSVLRRALTEAMEWGRLERLPRFKFMKTPPPTFDFLHPWESERLMEATTREPWRLMVRCALRTGMRFGELLGLRWQDVDFERNLLVVRRNVVDGNEGAPKNNRFRTIPLTHTLRSELMATPRIAERVFVLANGRTPNRWSAIEALQRACIRAGLRPVGWHTLRHTFASQLVGAGVNVAMIQALLGHSTLEMTMRYAHVSSQHMQTSVDALEDKAMTVVSRRSAQGEQEANSARWSANDSTSTCARLREGSHRNAKHSATNGVL